MNTIFNKIMHTWLRFFIGTVVISAAVFSATAAEKAEAKPSATVSGLAEVDWTPGSEWRKKLERETQKVDPRGPVAPPAFGRDKMKVKAKRAGKAGQETTPSSPSLSPAPTTPPGAQK